MSTKTVKCFNNHNKEHIAKHWSNSEGQLRTSVQALSTTTEDNTKENQKPEEVTN